MTRLVARGGSEGTGFAGAGVTFSALSDTVAEMNVANRSLAERAGFEAFNPDPGPAERTTFQCPFCDTALRTMAWTAHQLEPR